MEVTTTAKNELVATTAIGQMTRAEEEITRVQRYEKKEKMDE